MRKIFSILVVLGLVLGMVTMTAPTAAQTCTTPLMTVVTDCAGATATYTLTFTPTKSMLNGNDLFILDFGAGTTFGTVTVTVGATPVLAANIDKSAPPKLTFVTPVDVPAGVAITIVVTGVKNPSVAGAYKLLYSIKLVCCDPFAQGCKDYTIKPAYSTYKFLVDFGPTYAGIADGFIPPFKACGQVGFGTDVGDGRLATDFNLTFTYDVLGCAPPCTNATMWFVLTECPEDEEVYFSFNGTVFDTLDDEDVGDEQALPNIDPLEADTIITWPLQLHFSSPGDYEICFYVECTTQVECGDDAEQIIAEFCLPATVYQWKEAFEIPIYTKWNLISLPIVPFNTDIDAILAACAFADDIMGIWYFEGCTEEWAAYPDQDLETMEDGKAYWLRMPYNESPYGPAGTLVGPLWVWGTDRPGDPPMPVSYDVCEGWTMMGFTSLLAKAPAVYLSNWQNFFGVWGFGVIYGWAPTTQTYVLNPANLDAGKGYWVEFDWDGTIYP